MGLLGLVASLPTQASLKQMAARQAAPYPARSRSQWQPLSPRRQMSNFPTTWPTSGRSSATPFR